MGRYISALLFGVSLLVFSGCGPADPDVAIRGRWNQFMEGILSRDPDSSKRVMEPAYITEQGDGAISDRLAGFSKLLRAGKIKKDDLRIDQVTIAEDGKSATVSHSMRTQEGEWLSQAPYGRWVKVGGTWYITWR